jgi:hypothetical protein
MSESPDQETDGIQKVVVIDVDVKFWSLVGLMIKASIAVIPAAIILALLSGLFLAVFGVSLGAL